MAKTAYVAYYRVSTSGQGNSGLGLDAQKNSVETFVSSAGGDVVAEFREIESGRIRARPELKRALAECSRRGATLVIARLDRLARNLYVIASLMESRVDFVAADMPSASKLTIQLIAAIAEHERDQISRNTRLALKEAKARGVVLGNPRLGDVRPMAVAELQRRADEFAKQLWATVVARGIEGNTFRVMAERLNELGIPTQRNRLWTATGVKNIASRAAPEAHRQINQNQVGIST